MIGAMFSSYALLPIVLKLVDKVIAEQMHALIDTYRFSDD